MALSNNQRKKLEETITMVSADASIPAEGRREMIGALSKAMNPLDFDKWIYRFVVIFLGLTVLVVAVGGIIVVATDGRTDLPAGIIALGSAAVGALAGLLAPSPQRDSE